MEQLTIFDVLDKPKEKNDFDSKIKIIRRELRKINDYPDMTKWVFSKHGVNEESQYINPEYKRNEVVEVVLFASYVGTLIRLSYYKFVYKLKFDPRALWDAIILEYTFGEVFMTHLEGEIRKKPLKDIINKTPYPEWTKVGLLGGSVSQIKKLGEEFSKYMDGLK